MKYLDKTFSVGPPATTAMACERCVYGRGEHAEWCPVPPNEQYQAALQIAAERDFGPVLARCFSLLWRKDLA